MILEFSGFRLDCLLVRIPGISSKPRTMVPEKRKPSPCLPWKQILDLSALLFRRHERIMLAIRPKVYQLR